MPSWEATYAMTPTGTLTGKVEKGSQEPERADLNSKAETIMFSTTLGNEQTIFVIEMKIAGELLWRWFANIASIALFLFLGKIINRHPMASPLLRFWPQPRSLCERRDIRLGRMIHREAGDWCDAASTSLRPLSRAQRLVIRHKNWAG